MSNKSVVLVELESGSNISDVKASTSDVIVASIAKDDSLDNVTIHTVDTTSEGIDRILDAVVAAAGHGDRVSVEAIKKSQDEANSDA